jgi:hypothetical protein
LLKDLPSTPAALINWKWEEIEPHYKIIEACPLTTPNADEWLTDWTRLGEKREEMYARLHLASWPVARTGRHWWRARPGRLRTPCQNTVK